MKLEFQKYKSLSIFFLFFVGLAFSASLVAALSYPDPSLMQINNKGGVKISAQIIPSSKKPADEISFHLILSTHYIDLKQYDIQALAFLKVDDETLQPATAWDATGDNHHLEGILNFPEQNLEGSLQVQLILQAIGDVDNRIFEWNAPIKK